MFTYALNIVPPPVIPIGKYIVNLGFSFKKRAAATSSLLIESLGIKPSVKSFLRHNFYGFLSEERHQNAGTDFQKGG